MTMRWLAAGITAVLLAGGAATVAQRVITQKTRLVLPEKNDSAHPDSRRVVETSQLMVALKSESARSAEPPTIPPPLTDAVPLPTDPAASIVVTTSPEPINPPEPATAVVVPDAAPPRPTDEAITPTTAISPAAASPAEPASTVHVAKSPASDGAASKVDPVDSVESFVERNRKEAESAVQALSTEAETLKARLVRVEAALNRWQNFSRALNADQPASQPTVGPGSKLNWKRPDPESSKEPAASPLSKPSELPRPNPLSSTSPPEPSDPSTVPPQTLEAVPPQTEPKPPELPPSDPPSLPPPSKD